MVRLFMCDNVVMRGSGQLSWEFISDLEKHRPGAELRFQKHLRHVVPSTDEYVSIKTLLLTYIWAALTDIKPL